MPKKWTHGEYIVLYCTKVYILCEITDIRQKHCLLIPSRSLKRCALQVRDHNSTGRHAAESLNQRFELIHNNESNTLILNHCNKSINIKRIMP